MPKENAAEMERRFKSMDVLLNGLAEIGSNKEPLIDYAYSIALESVTESEHLKLLAEAMHKKWLSDAHFPPVAVRLTIRLGDKSVDDVCFRSLIYSMINNDYKDRVNLRKISRTLFCNSVHFAFEFMRYFYISKYGKKKMAENSTRMTRLSSSRSTLKTQSQVSLMSTCTNNPADVHVFSGMVDPMFDYLHMLIDDIATEAEISLLHYLLFLLGPKLEKLKSSKMHNLMFYVRRKLIDGQMTSKYRALLMELVELQSHKWDVGSLTPSVRDLYMKYRPDSYDVGVGMIDLPDENDSDEN